MCFLTVRNRDDLHAKQREFDAKLQVTIDDHAKQRSQLLEEAEHRHNQFMIDEQKSRSESESRLREEFVNHNKEVESKWQSLLDQLCFCLLICVVLCVMHRELAIFFEVRIFSESQSYAPQNEGRFEICVGGC